MWEITRKTKCLVDTGCGAAEAIRRPGDTGRIMDKESRETGRTLDSGL